MKSSTFVHIRAAVKIIMQYQKPVEKARQELRAGMETRRETEWVLLGGSDTCLKVLSSIFRISLCSCIDITIAVIHGGKYVLNIQFVVMSCVASSLPSLIAL